MDKKSIDDLKEFLDKGLASILAGDYEKALEDLKVAEVLDKENPEVLYNLSICYIRLGLYNTSYDYLLKILTLPYEFIDNEPVKLLFSFNCIKLEKFSEALDAIEDVLKLNKENTKALSMKGYVFEKMGDIDSAIELYEKLYSMDDTNENTMNSLAYLYSLKGNNSKEARDLAKKALSSRPGSSAYLDTMGYVLLKEGDNRAGEFFLRAKKISPFEKVIDEHIMLFKKGIKS
jgi:tetratricopeptide (TPR) repeat protein